MEEEWIVVDLLVGVLEMLHRGRINDAHTLTRECRVLTTRNCVKQLVLCVFFAEFSDIIGIVATFAMAFVDIHVAACCSVSEHNKNTADSFFKF